MRYKIVVTMSLTPEEKEQAERLKKEEKLSLHDIFKVGLDKIKEKKRNKNL